MSEVKFNIPELFKKLENIVEAIPKFEARLAALESRIPQFEADIPKIEEFFAQLEALTNPVVSTVDKVIEQKVDNEIATNATAGASN